MAVANAGCGRNLHWAALHFRIVRLQAPPILSSIARSLMDFAYPVSCLGCESASREHPLCLSCEGQMLRSAALPACIACGKCLAHEGAGCQSCLGKGHPHIERIARLGPYEGALRKLILAVKFEERWNLMPYLARQLATVSLVADLVNDAELAVPIPLHRWRLLQRGYNQAELLTRELLVGREEPAISGSLRRRRWTSKQSRQSSATARARNLRDAFTVHRAEEVAGKRVLLVDDVLTSGATAVEAARTLRRAGARSVDLLVLAVTDHPRYDE